MSAHFVRRNLCDKPLNYRGSPFHKTSTTSKIHRLNCSHTAGLEISATTLEMAVLLMAMLAMLALVIWLAWIALQHCISYFQGTVDDLNVGKQTKKNVKRAEEVPKKMFNVGLDLGRAARGCLDGLLGGKRGERERYGERRGLLRENDGMEAHFQGYGYDRERYGDGTNDSASSRNTGVSMNHREDCERQCGLTPRRWSGEA
jgi:hypothetical protein